MAKLRVGLLGCGRIGHVHAASVQRLPDAVVIAVADADPEAALKLSDQLGATTRTADEIIAAADIDAVVIATPTATHHGYLRQLVDAKKAVFCEKPIDLSQERARACAEAVESAGIPFMIAFNQRFDPHFSALQRRVADGEIGAIESIAITSRDPAPPPASYVRSSGGLFRDMMIHDFDLANFIMDESFVRVFAHGACLIDPEIGAVGDVDTASVTLITGSGRVCQISNSRRSAYGYDQRIEVLGAKGMLRVGNTRDTTLEAATEVGFVRDRSVEFFMERFAQAYENEMRHFVRSVIDGVPIRPGTIDALKAQGLADAADMSWRTGRAIDL